MTSMTWADNGAPGSFNAAYDVWFSTSSAASRTSSTERRLLMVWYHKPTDNQPIGTTMNARDYRRKNWNSGTARTAATASPASRTWRSRASTR